VRDRIERLEPSALRDVGASGLEPVLRVHPRSYLDALARIAAEGGGRLDPDTVMNSASWDAALGAVGAALAALDSALGGVPAFAAVRPPGHHTLREAPMGFCLIGSIVVAAREAQARGAERVLIIDWDVHHGNGTQALVEDDPTIRFISMHQWPHWPFSGAADERGVGNVFNLPLPPGLPPARYVETLWNAVVAATNQWSPDVILVSSGFDSMQGDLLGGFTLDPEHYAEWIRRVRERFANVPLAVLLEGGYVPPRLADGVVAVAEALVV